MLNKFSLIFISLGTALISTIPTNAKSQEKDRIYRTIWIIYPSEYSKGIKDIIFKEPILEQKLMPFGLSVLEENALSEDGAVLAEKGSQLFQLHVGVGKAYCVASVPRPSVWRDVMLRGNTQKCFVDGDSDGIFESHFNGSNEMKGVPFIEGYLPKKPKKLIPVKYSALPPNNFIPKYTIRIAPISMENSKDGQNLVVYKVDFGDDVARQELTSKFKRPIGEVSYLNSKWKLIEVSEKSIKIDLIQQMPPQPFQVMKLHVKKKF